MAHRAQDLREKVASWLENEGYPVEMTVARAFRRRQFRVNPSHWFTDPSTSMGRETDVLVRREGRVDDTIIRVSCVVECKWSGDKPWVMFTDSSISLEKPERVRYRSASLLGKKLLEAFADDFLLADTGLFRIRQRPAYKVTTAFDGKDRAYAAISAVSAATNAISKLSTEARVAEVLFPIVVFDGRIFDCHITEDGKTDVLEAPVGVLILRKQAADAPCTIIHLVTLSALDGLVNDVEKTADHLLNLNPKRVGQALGKP